MRYLALLAALPILYGPAVANPPCLSCVPRVRTKVIVKKVIKVEPVAVFVPSYVATLAPYAVAAPTYAPPPPPIVAPVAPPPPIYSPPQAIGYAAPQITPVVPVAAQAPICPTPPELLMFLQKLDARLCRLEDGNRPPGPGPQPQPPIFNPPQGERQGERMPGAGPPPVPEQENGKGNGQNGMQERGQAAPGGLPRAFTKCAACHTEGALKGGDKNAFTMFDKAGKIAALNDKQWKRVLVNAYSGAMPPKDNSLKVAPLTDEEVAELVQYAANQK